MLFIAASLYACNEHKKRLLAEKTTRNIVASTQPALIQKTIKEYRDSANRNHTVIENVPTVKETLDKLMPFVDSVSKALDVKPKQVESVIVVPTETQAKQVAFMQKKVDSLQRLTYYYKDKYLQLAIRSGNPADTTDKGDFDFKYNAELAISQYWKRRKFLGIGLGAKQSYIDISSDDPRTTIMGVKKYTVKQKQPSFGLRVQAIQNYSFISNSASTGLRASFDLRHLSFTGGYYYNWQLRQWRPSVSVGYDIIRF